MFQTTNQILLLILWWLEQQVQTHMVKYGVAEIIGWMLFSGPKDRDHSNLVYNATEHDQGSEKGAVYLIYNFEP